MWKHIIRSVVVTPHFRRIMSRANAEVSSLKHVFEKVVSLSDTPVRDAKALQFCQKYMDLGAGDKEAVINFIAQQHKFKTENAKKNAEVFSMIPDSQVDLLIKAARQLKESLNPSYNHMFAVITKLDCGVKFLVDLRSDVLEHLQEMDPKDTCYHLVKILNYYLKDMLAFSFNVGFLSLQRITWDSSCYMLQKISEYEAVHPVRNWTDLKQRVGPYRRCYVFTHSSMPKEPIVVLHTALTEDISSHIDSIVKHKHSLPKEQTLPEKHITHQNIEDPSKIQAAIFYSITSTQKGLHGIELGNKLIKKVVGEILKEFPHISKLSSLSPIPGFREWLLMELKKLNEGVSIVPDLLTKREITDIAKVTETTESGNVWSSLGHFLISNRWIHDDAVRLHLRDPLMKLCAHYLYREKRRSYALNSVAHFHLRNGAVLWRLNWEADLSPRGLDNSCGIMVNYRYFMEETEVNSQNYTENQIIKISKDVEQYLPQLMNKL